MSKTGDMLRAAREAKGVSIEEASRGTRISVKYLDALEAGNFDALPAPAYARGYLNTYARYLGIDSLEVLKAFNDECGIQEPRGVQSEVKIRGGGPVITPAPFIALVVVAIIAVAVVFLYQQYSLFIADTMSAQEIGTATAAVSATEPTIVVDTPTPTATSAPTATPTSVKGVTVQINVIQRCWFQVKVDGTVVLAQTLEAGESRTWTANDKIEMRAGFPNGVEATVNGKPIGRLAPPGTGALNIQWTSRD